MAARMSFALPNTQKPSMGPCGVNVPFAFSAGVQQVSSDLALEQMQDQIDYVQSIFIDNRLNLVPFVINFSGLQYTIQCRAGRSGIWPVICSPGALAFTAISAVAAPITVNTIMMNSDLKGGFFTWDN